MRTTLLVRNVVKGQRVASSSYSVSRQLRVCKYASVLWDPPHRHSSMWPRWPGASVNLAVHPTDKQNRHVPFCTVRPRCKQEHGGLLFDFLYVHLQSWVKMWVSIFSASQTTRKMHSTVNWVSRHWLCAVVPSSWNWFHMAELETFPVGKACANGL